MGKRITNLIAILTVFCSVSCVFDFDADLESASYLVIEGDIVVGGETRVSLSETEPLKYRGEHKSVKAERVYVETESGKVYEGNVFSGRYIINTETLSKDERCRLVVKYGDSYVSDWLMPVETPPIDGLSYTIDNDLMKIQVSTHSDGDDYYYMWNAHENWEYHADMQAMFYYKQGLAIQYDRVLPFENGENTYYCWDEEEVTDLMFYSTEPLLSNTVCDYNLFSRKSDDSKLSYIYSVCVTQKSISCDAYRYYQNLSRNSDDLGGLFSPQPSEMRGNITDIDNPDKPVVGFIQASTVSTKRIFIYDSETHFYKYGRAEDVEAIAAKQSRWRELYNKGYYVYNVEDDQMSTDIPSPISSTYDWVPRKCVDCTYFGGSKNKPSWWPTLHK